MRGRKWDKPSSSWCKLHDDLSCKLDILASSSTYLISDWAFQLRKIDFHGHFLQPLKFTSFLLQRRQQQQLDWRVFHYARSAQDPKWGLHYSCYIKGRLEALVFVLSRFWFKSIAIMSSCVWCESHQQNERDTSVSLFMSFKNNLRMRGWRHLGCQVLSLAFHFENRNCSHLSQTNERFM